MEKFPCAKCGTCCRNIDKIEELKEFDLGNGTCKFLRNDLCGIYDERPDICRVDLMYKKYFSKRYSLEEYYLLNIEGCKKLKSEQ